MPKDPADVTRLVDREPCSQGQDSTFAIAGRGGLPPTPFDPLGGSAAAIEWVEFPHPSIDLGEREGERLSFPREATTWILDPNGQIALVSQMPTRPILPQLSCRAID